jgi:hypothetical protein
MEKLGETRYVLDTTMHKQTLIPLLRHEPSYNRISFYAEIVTTGNSA